MDSGTLPWHRPGHHLLFVLSGDLGTPAEGTHGQWDNALAPAGIPLSLLVP